MRMKRIVAPLPCASRRQADEALELAGMGISACIVLPSRSRCISTPTVSPLLRMNGNGWAGIDGDRRQDREDLAQEQAVQPLALGRLSSLGSTISMPALAISVFSSLQQACWSLTRLRPSG